MVTYQDIIKDPAINVYIEQADAALRYLGYTEHAYAHVGRCAETAGRLLRQLGYSDREVELAKIAGYMHDIGNVVNRTDHAQSGAMMAFRLLDHQQMDPGEIAVIISAIGNHDESTAFPVNPVAAALILADKSDVRRTRVRNPDMIYFDIHDRVNYAVVNADLNLDIEHREITLLLTIDNQISSVADYFEIFLGRMLLCKRAATYFDLSFRLKVNDIQLM